MSKHEEEDDNASVMADVGYGNENLPEDENIEKIHGYLIIKPETKILLGIVLENLKKGLHYNYKNKYYRMYLENDGEGSEFDDVYYIVDYYKDYEKTLKNKSDGLGFKGTYLGYDDYYPAFLDLNAGNQELIHKVAKCIGASGPDTYVLFNNYRD